jgi:hypothetical protein
MSCNKILKPELTEQQIAKCKECKFASEKKRWCSKFGFYFVQPEKKIIQPNKKLILPDQKIQKPCPKPTLAQMAVHFTSAMIRWGKSGLKCVDRETYIKRRMICSDCTKCRTCPHCGCMLWAKVALATEKCPESKW